MRNHQLLPQFVGNGTLLQSHSLPLELRQPHKWIEWTSPSFGTKLRRPLDKLLWQQIFLNQSAIHLSDNFSRWKVSTDQCAFPKIQAFAFVFLISLHHHEEYGSVPQIFRFPFDNSVSRGCPASGMREEYQTNSEVLARPKFFFLWAILVFAEFSSEGKWEIRGFHTHMKNRQSLSHGETWDFAVLFHWLSFAN